MGTQGHGEIDGIPFDVVVGSPDLREDVSFGPGARGVAVTLSTDGTLGHASARAGEATGSGPCDQAIATLHLPLAPADVVILDGDPEGVHGVDVERHIAEARPLLDQILASVRPTG